MQPNAYPGRESLPPAVIGEPALDGNRALDRHVHVIERQEESVACRLDLLAAVLGDERSEGLVVPSQDA